jgi:hypothetical protein
MGLLMKDSSIALRVMLMEPMLALLMAILYQNTL